LNAKPGIRTAVEKSAHNKRPSRGRCLRATLIHYDHKRKMTSCG
jgi:hypothetical protein